MNADPAVMEHFPCTLTAEQSARMLPWIETGFAERGYGLWAVELPDEAAFVGFVGLSPVDFESPFSPAVEIGWRLAATYWGRGYATEAAASAMSFGFEKLDLDEIVSFTAQGNIRSRRVMERLHMTHDPGDDFDHPRLARPDPLCRHVLYRIDRPAWRARCGSRPIGAR
jgi:RimJ/RimL family protein N-acetyltransferase